MAGATVVEQPPEALVGQADDESASSSAAAALPSLEEALGEAPPTTTAPAGAARPAPTPQSTRPRADSQPQAGQEAPERPRVDTQPQTPESPSAAPVPEDLPQDVREALEKVATLSKDAYERFVRANPRHPLAVLSQAEASRELDRQQKSLKAQQDAASTQQAQIDRWNEYQKTLGEAFQEDDYDVREVAREKLLSSFAAEYQSDQMLRQPAVWEQVRQRAMQDPEVWAQAGKIALEYLVESAHEHPTFKPAGDAAFTEARSSAANPADYYARLHTTLLEQHVARNKLVPESEIETRVKARLADERSSGYGSLVGHDTAAGLGQPSYAKQIDWNKPADEMFDDALSAPRNGRP